MLCIETTRKNALEGGWELFCNFSTPTKSTTSRSDSEFGFLFEATEIRVMRECRVRLAVHWIQMFFVLHKNRSRCQSHWSLRNVYWNFWVRGVQWPFYQRSNVSQNLSESCTKWPKAWTVVLSRSRTHTKWIVWNDEFKCLKFQCLRQRYLQPPKNVPESGKRSSSVIHCHRRGNKTPLCIMCINVQWNDHMSTQKISLDLHACPINALSTNFAGGNLSTRFEKWSVKDYRVLS